jgi:hypothetical protein
LHSVEHVLKLRPCKPPLELASILTSDIANINAENCYMFQVTAAAAVGAAVPAKATAVAAATVTAVAAAAVVTAAVGTATAVAVAETAIAVAGTAIAVVETAMAADVTATAKASLTEVAGGLSHSLTTSQSLAAQ